jgi:hypothetical protein
MNTYALESLMRIGYTDREATFIYMVAVHSGYFLQRQYTESVNRKRGGIATRFIRKAIGLGHIRALLCSEGRHIYHLSGKQVYRAIDQGDSQSRRLKSNPEIKRRLVALDYILLNLGRQSFVESIDDRQQLFASLQVKKAASESAARFLQYVLVSFARIDQSVSVRFAFIDDAMCSTSQFAKFLEAYGELIRDLERVEIRYVSTSPINFKSAKRVFEQHMPMRNSLTPVCPLGVEHLVQWLEVQEKFRDIHGPISPAEHRLFLEGQSIYRAPVHVGLIASWGNGVMDAMKVRELFKVETRRAELVTELLDTDYPKMLGPSVGRSMGSVRGQESVQNGLFQKGLSGNEGKVEV